VSRASSLRTIGLPMKRKFAGSDLVLTSIMGGELGGLRAG
jgi:hypothetical protein